MMSLLVNDGAHMQKVNIFITFPLRHVQIKSFLATLINLVAMFFSLIDRCMYKCFL